MNLKQIDHENELGNQIIIINDIISDLKWCRQYHWRNMSGTVILVELLHKFQ